MDNTWWKKMPLRWEGDALLFTGLMYQFNPYIEESTKFLEKFEDTKFGGFLSGSAKYMPSRLSGIGLAVKTSRKEKKRANKILQDIATLLIKSNVDFYYKPKLDDYSGILLYDLGDQENFIKHANYVAGKLKKAGVKKIITVDPHTTYALKVLYPEYTGERFDVKAYFELINLKSNNGNGTRITLHDPCFYGRYLELSGAPRKVLGNLGVTVDEVRNCGTFTSCCGGPAESVSPALSKEVMERRVEELQSTGAPIVAMCPICLGNLRKSGADVEDLSAVLARSVE
jgi:Fe-S oxidoreductase